MPFYVSPVDPRVTPGYEIMLSPGPTTVQYPGTLNGDKITTPDGRVIVQQPTADPRTRQWVWQGYPARLAAYERQYELLRTFRARARFEAGLSPYVYVRETETKQLRRQVTQTCTVAASGNTTTTLLLQASAMLVAEGTVEVLPNTVGGTGTGAYQIRQIQSMTKSEIVVSTPFDTVPDGAQIRVTGVIDDWFRARVLDVDRTVQDQGGTTRYSTTFLEFVVEDTFTATGITGAALDHLALTVSSPTVTETQAAPTTTTSALNTQGGTVSGLKYTYSSTNPSVASIDAAGVVTIHAPGTTELRVDALGLSAGVLLTVLAITEIDVAPQAYAMTVVSRDGTAAAVLVNPVTYELPPPADADPTAASVTAAPTTYTLAADHTAATVVASPSTYSLTSDCTAATVLVSPVTYSLSL